MTTAPRDYQADDNAHIFTLDVFWEDTDAGGVVYYANYLRFAERARSTILRQAGIDQQALWQQENTALMVRKCQILYHAPARLEDHLTVVSKPLKIGKAQLILSQNIFRDQTLLAEMEVQLAAVNGQGRPTRIPSPIIKALELPGNRKTIS